MSGYLLPMLPRLNASRSIEPRNCKGNCDLYLCGLKVEIRSIDGRKRGGGVERFTREAGVMSAAVRLIQTRSFRLRGFCLLFLIFNFQFSILLAQSRAVLTSKDHLPGNISATSAAYGTLLNSGGIRSTAMSGDLVSMPDTLGMTATNEPISRSYYLWAEKTSATPFVGGMNEVLLSALTVNGYEDLVEIQTTGPKAGVEGTRVDIPMSLTLTYGLSTGSTPSVDGTVKPTTASTYARAGSTAEFGSTEERVAEVGFSYRTGGYGSVMGDWIGPYVLFQNGATTASMNPSELPQGRGGLDMGLRWQISFGIQQSSLRELSAFKTVTVYPLPELTAQLVRNFGVDLSPTPGGALTLPKVYKTRFEADPMAFPDLSIQALKGFPLTRWELVHEKPDGSRSILETVVAGTNPTADVDFTARSIALRNHLKEEGTHVLRLYNRFDSPATVPEASELVMEWTFETAHIIKVRAHIHEYGG